MINCTALLKTNFEEEPRQVLEKLKIGIDKN